MISIMECIHVPSLERLVWGGEGKILKIDVDDICDSLVQLRHLTLRHMNKLRRRVPALLLDHLKHLETLTTEFFSNADELFIALSSPSRGSSTPCPYLKTVDISFNVYVKLDVLVKFIQQRVKSDLDVRHQVW